MSESLVARLEQAEKGSRELDVAIWHLVETKFQRSEIMVGWSVVPNGTRTVKDDVFAPSYTKSVDAAMTLIPEEWHVSHLWWDTERASANLTLKVSVYESGNAKTPALALTAASLKARA